jgi:hypothetical protein
MFDWERFLRTHNIPYVTKGPSITKGHVAIHCPFCGAEDPSQHLSIDLHGKGWRCWRHPDSHKGVRPTRLIQTLLGCTWEQATRLSGAALEFPNTFAALTAHAFDPPSADRERQTPLKLPAEFKLLAARHSCQPYLNYLHQRGLTLARLLPYKLYYATRGPFRGRIIFPVYFNGELVSWTGRTIYPADPLRYKTLATDPERAAWDRLPPARGAIGHYLLWFDELLRSNADTICLCEGPFDALKVRVLGERIGITATCLFTSTASQAQVDLLHELLPRFRTRLIMLDRDMVANATRLAGVLRWWKPKVQYLPVNLKDPGELRDTKTLQNLISRLTP